MSAEMLLDELTELGIHLERKDEAIFAKVESGANITLHTERIKANKPELLAALQLREQIIAAVTVEPEFFNREEYDRLWVLWHAENAKEESTP